MLDLAGRVGDLEEGRELLCDKLKNGDALKKFAEMIAAQEGNQEIIDDFNLLPETDKKVEVKAEKDGYISNIGALEVGIAAMLLGAGRETKDSEINLAVGIVLEKKVGDKVKKGETLAVLHVDDEKNLEEAKSKLAAAFNYSKEKPEKKELIYEIIK